MRLRAVACGCISGAPWAPPAPASVFHFAHLRCKKGVEIIFVRPKMTKATRCFLMRHDRCLMLRQDRCRVLHEQTSALSQHTMLKSQTSQLSQCSSLRSLNCGNVTMFKSQMGGLALNPRKCHKMGPEWSPGPENRSLGCLLYTSPSPRDGLLSRMPSSA